MFITDKKELERFVEGKRIWQGMPSIAVTKKGRIFSAFYSGGVTEEIGNFVVLQKSDDGLSFSGPIAVCYCPDGRCFDECLWIDNLGRLWLFWSFQPTKKEGTYAVICENPDNDELVWSAPFLVGNNVMLNKPIVLSNGDWLLPISVWPINIRKAFPFSYDVEYETGAFVYKSVDSGRTFTKLGSIVIENRTFDEHMVIEMKDGSLKMFIRSKIGISVANSYDFGRTWIIDEKEFLPGPSSRFFVSRLKSGNILFINHYNFTGRNNLCAFLSDDECKTWKYRLMLDERDYVSYPDAMQDENGIIHITYDRERGAYLHSLEENALCAKEILC